MAGTPEHPLTAARSAVGWAGNGLICGRDTDLDGFPDGSYAARNASAEGGCGVEGVAWQG